MKHNRLDAKALNAVFPTHLKTAPVNRSLGARRRELLGLLGLSAALDVGLFIAELPLEATLFGLPLVVDEILEFGISALLGRNKLKLRWHDRLIGLLPIPGVTAITVRVAQDLVKSFTNPQAFMEEAAAIKAKELPDGVSMDEVVEVEELDSQEYWKNT